MRHYQRDFLGAVHAGLNVCSVCHRRAGKDVISVQAWLLRALTRVGTHVYLFPLVQQARSVIWKGMDFDGRPFLAAIPDVLIRKKNEARMEIELINGSRMVLGGSNNYNGLMGTNPITIIYSEFSLHNPMARQYLNPILVQNGGIEIFQFTPRGKNHGWEVMDAVRENPRYFVQHLNVEQTFKDEARTQRVITAQHIEEAAKMGMSDEMIRQEFMCFTPETQITTSNGQIPISNIKQGDVVLTHSGRWRCVDGVLQSRFNGDLIVIKSAGCFEDIKCTPEHPLRVYHKENQSYEWIKAKELHKGHYLVFPKLSSPGSSSPHALSEDWVKIIGWYISEGSTSKSGISFSIHSQEHDYCQEITESLSRLGFNYKIYTRGSVQNITVNSVFLSDFLTSSCGSKCYFKKIPFNLIQGHEALLFEVLIKGDGCLFQDNRSSTTTYQYTTTSKTLAYQVQLLGNSIGLRMTITKCTKPKPSIIDGREIISKHDKFDVRGTRPNTYEQKQRTPLRCVKYGIASYVRSVTSEPYEGLVYNLNVAHDHTYIANGRVVHNCDFDVGNIGAYFTREMSDMEIEGRITTLRPNPNLPLHSVWDLGGTDATAGWLFQLEGQYINLVHILHDSGQGLKYYLEKADQIRQSFKLRWGNHFMPHDVKQGHQGWEQAESRLMIARQHGWFFQVTPKVNFEDGIEAMRHIFPKLRIDKLNCGIGLRALREYQREYDELRACYKSKPLDNWATHIVDALRYLAVNYRRLYEMPQAVSKYDTSM